MKSSHEEKTAGVRSPLFFQVRKRTHEAGQPVFCRTRDLAQTQETDEMHPGYTSMINR